MQTGRATLKGAVTDRLINFYVKRSSALGLLIVEHAYISQDGKLSPKQLGIYDDDLIDGLEKLSNSIHSADVPAVVQITHAGCVANRKLIGTDPLGPSSSGKTHELSGSEIDALIENFGRAAKRAVKAEFDGVELHGAHGFLLNQFFSPLMNKRHDEYGGSIEKRMRFPLKVVQKVREEIGQKLLLYRLGADDLAPKGIRIEDSVVFAKRLERSGVDIIDVSGGMCGSEPKQLREVKGYFVPQAEKIKKAVKVPVIGVGGINEADYADRLVREERVDLVAVGRAIWKDPNWAEKAVQMLKTRASL
jgi:2,4-dienoyl-CoA reductase-like NADH-dependent reductase (Old Yellow Enzyme family)